MDDIKQNDTPTIGWDLDPEPGAGATALVIISAGHGYTPIVNRAGTVAGARVTIELTAEETAVDGFYIAEVQITDGETVDTYPHDGYDEIRIVADLG